MNAITRHQHEYTVVLSENEAISLRCALARMLGSYRDEMGQTFVDEAHPASCVGYGKKLLNQLTRASMGHQDSESVSYRMVEKA